MLHNLLIHKLTTFVFSGNLLNLFRNYLDNRKQHVVIEGTSSKLMPVVSGVPQGSILRPLLFLYYINNIVKIPGNPDNIIWSLYADDTKIGSSIECEQDIINLQLYLDGLCTWCSDWGMQFNASKRKLISFKRSKLNYDTKYLIGNTYIERVYDFIDLGIIVNHNLSWSQNVNSCVKKARSRLALIKRTIGHDVLLK